MSHIAEISDLYITDLDALETAARSIGLELIRGQQTYKWYGVSVGDTPLPQGFKSEDLGHCSHALRVPGNSQAYEIGIVERRDGEPGYTLLWDYWQGGFGLEKLVGENADNLRYQYSLAVTRKQCAEQGFWVSEETQPDGTVVIVASRG